MAVFAVISALLLAIIMVWAVYHARILLVGLLGKYKNLPAPSGNTVFPFKFSVIVPAKEEGLVIGRCLTALVNVDYPQEQLEVLVVTGVSKDGTRQICEEFAAKYPSVVKIVNEGDVEGKPAALNLGLAHVTGQIVGVFDADSVPQFDVLKKVASYFETPSVVAVQGSSYSVNENENMLTRVAAKEDKAWVQGLLHGREKLGLFVAFTGSCQFIRTATLKELGGWASFSYAEDVDLSLKLAEHGFFIKFASDVCCGQETPFSFKSLVTQRTRWYRGYMECTFKYASFLRRCNRQVVDAGFSLIGPFVMIVCLASYVNWGLSLLFASASTVVFSPVWVVVLNSATLVSLGASMAFLVKPARLHNLFWVPFIYLYWLLQMFIAARAFFQILLRRRSSWQKTAKSGRYLQGRP